MGAEENLNILATDKSWHLEAFTRRRTELKGSWLICPTPADLTAAVRCHSPRYVFFPHWSHIVGSSILESVECVCFHMTDLPYGRGGSPLQNLIARGHHETVLSALKMTDVLDGGPIYAKRPLSLAGSAAEIFERTAELIIDLIAWIVEKEPVPQEQCGEATVFTRRKPAQSLIEPEIGLEKLYDHIRMLDAPSYPHAFIEHGDWRIEFTDAIKTGDGLQARANLRQKSRRDGE